MEREQATKFIYDLLRALLAKKGSDLFITAGFPPAMKIDTADVTHSERPPLRKKIICDPVASASAMPATGRRPRASANRPPTSTPTIPGRAVVTARNAAMPVLEKPRTSVRYLLVNCDATSA